ncbi:general substrate transporter [Hortaea werneckii]|nr:general substrate transporter [Hortaea werneckii]
MTGFAKAKEDRPTPAEVYNWKVYTSAILISLGVMAYGYDSAFIGTTITQDSFERDFGLDQMTTSDQDAVSSNLTSIYSAGGFFGALFMFFSLELLGRKMTVIISDTIFIIGAVLCTAASGKLGVLYAGRLLTGLGVGGIAAVCPIYVAEISPPAIRGRLTGFFESSYQIGAVIGFWINYGIVHNISSEASMAWRIPMGVQLIPAGLLAIGIPFLRESPIWLLKKGRDDEALNVYGYYRNLPIDHHYIAEDVAFVRGQIQHERAVTAGERPTFAAFLKGALRESLMKGMRNRFALVFLMFMWQGWSGAAAINYYSPTIFKSIGLTDVTLWTVCQYYLAGYIAVGDPTSDGPMSASTVAGGKAATAAIMIFGATWSFGANGLPWIISAEIFPSSLRSISGPWAGMSVWLWTYVVTKALPSMYTSMGYGVYIFFATMLIGASIYAYFFIHETKGLRFDQISALFGFEEPEMDYTSKSLEDGDSEKGEKSGGSARVEVA